MEDKKITKSEADLLINSICKIISSEVLEHAIPDHLPLTEELTDSNKIYNGKVSVLFVDMRGSTKLSDKFCNEQLVKIYRSYIRTVVQAIRYSGGAVRDFMGDGVLAVFTDNEEGKSEDKAVQAARYIATAIDKFLNPELDKYIKHRISCGIGIHTGEISLSKVGMKGKEQDENVENEFGIAWIGNSTNFACKFSGAVDNETIFISASTYAALSNIDEKCNWQEFEVAKENNVLKGYIARQYYLHIDDHIEPCIATTNNMVISIEDRLSKEYQKQLIDIFQKAEELGKKEQVLLDKEQKLKEKESEVNLKEKAVCQSRLELNEKNISSIVKF